MSEAETKHLSQGAGAEGSVATQRAALSRLHLIAALVSLVGLADSIYLTVKHLTGETVQCTLLSGCDVVLSSAYSSFMGLPLAPLGAAAYFAVFSLATLAAFGYRGMRVPLLLVVGVMLLMTLRLLYVQAFVLHHYCEFCLLSALVTLTLTGLMLYSIQVPGLKSQVPGR
ncbi:MAG: vitamin K epoxide reductase family protein [Acidobacteria bacterium]|nr:vitamin K epoxide reductase family protein [Acidobacteriota bacterium]